MRNATAYVQLSRPATRALTQRPATAWSSCKLPLNTEQSTLFEGTQSVALSVYCQYVQLDQPLGIGGIDVYPETQSGC